MGYEFPLTATTESGPSQPSNSRKVAVRLKLTADPDYCGPQRDLLFPLASPKTQGIAPARAALRGAMEGEDIGV